MNKDSALKIKSQAFAIRIVRLCRYLNSEKKETILSKQLLRSGTSIGANISESTYAQSMADFISKLHIALKEAAETEYWINILAETEYITSKEKDSILTDCIELIRLLTSSIKTCKESSNNP